MLQESNVYLKRIKHIEDQKNLAQTFDAVKLSVMSKVNPNYARNMLLEKSEKLKNNTLRIDANKTTDSQMKDRDEGASHTQTSTKYNSEMEMHDVIQKYEDLGGDHIFTEDQMETLTLEQKMLIGAFIPKVPIKKDPNVIEI